MAGGGHGAIIAENIWAKAGIGFVLGPDWVRFGFVFSPFLAEIGDKLASFHNFSWGSSNPSDPTALYITQFAFVSSIDQLARL
jgi:hypothetical protein